MFKDMKANGKKDKLMEEENSFIMAMILKKNLFMKEVLRTEKEMEKVNFIGQMDLSMMVTFLIILFMALVFIFGKMEEDMKGTKYYLK